jgi:hypothetical protein
MFTSIVLAAISGYCGNDRIYELLRRLRSAFGGIGGYQFDPQFPWPPNCPQCGRLASIAGGVIAYYAVNQLTGSPGLDVAATIATGFVGGRLASQIGNELGGRLTSK